jgi:type IV secretory pathway TrbF-like protein|tara:strand:- start:588 stop:821 length:234 start_codon:yes stop_codon:yes gene_type:complete
MTLELYTELRNPINSRVNKYSDILNSFAKNASGMVDVTEAFKSAKNSYELAFNELRILNGATSNKIKREFSKANRGY